MNKHKDGFIPYGCPSVDESDINAVCNVLRGNWLSQGPSIEKFEEKIAHYCGVRYAVVVSSGTAALHLACMATGLSKGDYHWTSPVTFVATSNCGVYCGSRPEFVDIDTGTYNMDVTLLEEKLVEAKKEGRLPKVVIPVHFAGLPCDMKSIHALSEEYGFQIIEDACHALGARYRTKSGEWTKVGSCTHSDMTVFSFHPVKHITTGEGGSLTTNDKKVYELLLMLRNHGITKDQRLFSNTNNEAGLWYYEMQTLGYNYRLSDIHCALGISQLSRLDEMIKKRQELALQYDGLLSNVSGITPQKRMDGYENSFHLYITLVDYEGYGTSRTELVKSLKDFGIGTQVHYIPVYSHPYYIKHFNVKSCDYPNAEEYYAKALSFPLFADITEQTVAFIVEKLLELLENKLVNG